ncbi:hypothetical protein TNIN_104061, partial [Trichonephila inaurata madagascariensis]
MLISPDFGSEDSEEAMIILLSRNAKL